MEKRAGAPVAQPFGGKVLNQDAWRTIASEIQCSMQRGGAPATRRNFSPLAAPAPMRRTMTVETLALFITFWNAYARNFFTRARKTANFPRRGRRFRRFHPKPAARTPSPNADKKTGRRGWVALPAAKPATLRGSHRTLFSWGVARPPAPGAGSRIAAGRGGADRREARARRLPGSRGARRSPCFSTSGHWFGTATRRALCGFSPLDCQDKPKVDNDGKPGVSGTPQTGSCNFSRASLLESGEPDDMVRQLREQGRVAGLRRAPRRQGREQPLGGPVARPARPPAPTGESTRPPASGGPAKVKSWFGCMWPPGTRSRWPSTSPGRQEPRLKS